MLFHLLIAEGAAVAAFDLGSIAAPVSALTSVGFAVWYAYYVTTVAMPKLMDAHRAERTEMQTRFDTAIHDLLGEMKEQRQQFSEWMTREGK